MAEDKTLTCADCGASFTFTAQEQDFFAEKGLTNEPKRCQNCRKARRERQASSPRGGGGGGARRSGGPPRREGGPGGGGHRPPMSRGPGGASSARPGFSATCARCGVETTVPFKPAAGRPVYCRDCFRSMS
ncbi:MAG: zinc-ribbon domain containing protein [Planctomycetes bacterium]|nr:zinc-ribbon domain containing protein [Planctomycetota bacterium]MBI3846062.1 zinc-ribbon domain containing protein [Planctomycetota bacterium]